MEIGTAREAWLAAAGLAAEDEDTEAAEDDVQGVLQFASLAGTHAPGERSRSGAGRSPCRCASSEGYTRKCRSRPPTGWARMTLPVRAASPVAEDGGAVRAVSSRRAARATDPVRNGMNQLRLTRVAPRPRSVETGWTTTATASWMPAPRGTAWTLPPTAAWCPSRMVWCTSRCVRGPTRSSRRPASARRSGCRWMAPATEPSRTRPRPGSGPARRTPLGRCAPTWTETASVTRRSRPRSRMNRGIGTTGASALRSARGLAVGGGWTAGDRGHRGECSALRARGGRRGRRRPTRGDSALRPAPRRQGPGRHRHHRLSGARVRGGGRGLGAHGRGRRHPHRLGPRRLRRRRERRHDHVHLRRHRRGGYRACA